MTKYTLQDRINYLHGAGKVTDEMTQEELEQLAAQVSEAELGIAASIGAI